MLRKFSCLKTWAVFVFLAGSQFSQCQTSDQVRRVGDYYAKADGFSGNVLVVREGKLIGRQSYGMASLELAAPNTAATRFAIGSVTKQFTAAAILLLQEQGLLKTTDTLAQDYPNTPEAWKDVTLREVLQHTSGIADGLAVWGAAGKENGEPTPEAIVASVASKPLVFTPGSRMEYNNTGYILLGLIVEKKSGQSFSDFLQTHFFTPLQMRDTGLASSHEVIHNMASGYDPGAKGIKTSIPLPFTSLFSAGAMYSTAADIAKWLTALHTGKVLKPASYLEMTTPDADTYGYGLWIFRQSGQLDIGHNGEAPGFASQTDFLPGTKTGVVVLSNQMNRALISPGENALDFDLRSLAADRNAPVRSLGGERHISAATLTGYTGIYVAADPAVSLIASVELKDGHLLLSSKGRQTRTLVATSDHEFYSKEQEEEVEFSKSSDGKWQMDIFTLPIEAKTSMKKTSNLPQ